MSPAESFTQGERSARYLAAEYLRDATRNDITEAQRAKMLREAEKHQERADWYALHASMFKETVQ